MLHFLLTNRSMLMDVVHTPRTPHTTHATIGKLFHPGVPPNFDQPYSWSATSPDGTPWPYQDTPNGANASTKCNSGGLSFKDEHFCLTTPSPNSRSSGKATYLQDEVVTNVVLDRLGDAIANYKKTTQPFFVGLGTHRPVEIPRSNRDFAREH